MAVEAVPAKNSLLLDYVTPLQLYSFWRSIKRRHFNVSAGILVFVLIKVITVLSTGLFSLQTIQKNNVSTSMALNNTFTSKSYNASNVDSRAAFVAYGNKAYNISLPIGTTDKYTMQSFAPEQGPINGSLTYSATVDIFSSSLSCESGKITHTTAYDDDQNAPQAAYYNTTVTLPDCEVHGAYLDAPDWYFEQNQTTHYFGYWASFQNVTCSNLPPSDPTRLRYMISATYNEGLSQDNNTMLNSSNVVCKPLYSVQPALVTLDILGNVLDVNITGQGRQVSGVSGADIAAGVLRSSTKAYGISTDSQDFVSKLDPFTALMQQETPGFRLDNLLDHSFLNSTGNKVFGQIAAQVANLYLLDDESASSAPAIQGTVSKDESRLIARQLPIRLMQGIAGLMLLLVAVMLLVRPRGVVPRNIDSIAAITAILARSPELEARLRGTGHKTLNELREILAPHKFRTITGYGNGTKTFAIEMLSRSGTELHKLSDEDDNPLHNIKWIRPFILRRIGILLTVTASVAAIIALEVLLSQSDKNNGLGTVNGNENNVQRYSWLYVPVLIFLFLATLFNSMDFEIEFTESFHALAKADCDARSSMLWYPLRHVSIHATYNGIRHNRFALTAASLSALLAPLLTIIVSGLFVSKPTVQGIPVNVKAMNWFNTTTNVTTSSNVPLLVIEGNMSFPQWTYSELALPQLNLTVDTATQVLVQGGSLSVDTPAIRGGVQCEVVPKDDINEAYIMSGGRGSSANYLQSNISVQSGCGNSAMHNGPYKWLTNGNPVVANASGYYGDSLVLENGAECPTLALYFGHVTDMKIDNFSVVLCKQYLERVQANVTFTLPDYTISTDPTVKAGSGSNFSSFHTTFPTLQAISGPANDQMDNTFNAMIYGKGGVPTNELLNNTKLIEAYTHLYRLYTAQTVNTYLRNNFSTLPNTALETVTNPLQATYVNPKHYRLMQSALSTHLLVGVVGGLLLCALVVFITIDMREVLPKPVGSIAAVASLLAGSRIVDPRYGMVPPGSEYWSDDEWEKSGVWRSEMFRMGWWDKFQEPVESGSRGSSIRGARNPFDTESDDERVGKSFELPGSFRIDARPKIR